jgi:hypothetical protein
MASKTVFRVTKRDIAQAPETGNCPVGAAIDRRLGRAVAVGRRFVWIGRRRIALPGWVSDRIREWDRRGTMRPFRFSMDIGGAR